MLNIRLVLIKMSKFTNLLTKSKKLVVHWQTNSYDTYYKTFLFKYLQNRLNKDSLPALLLASSFINLYILVKLVFSNFNYTVYCLKMYLNLNIKQVVGESFIVLICLMIVFYTDALLTDDEPIWEPTE